MNTDGHHGITTTTSMDTINTDDPDMKLGRDGEFIVTSVVDDSRRIFYIKFKNDLKISFNDIKSKYFSII